MNIEPNAPMAKFPMGQILITPGAHRAINDSDQAIRTFLCRHQTGDWGDIDEEDKRSNERALTEKGQIISAYHTERGVKLWVMTEWDRSSTTILLPSEY